LNASGGARGAKGTSSPYHGGRELTGGELELTGGELELAGAVAGGRRNL